jgi:hypothetical protein
MWNPDRPPEWMKATTVVIDGSAIKTAECQIESCDSCAPELAEIPFDSLIDSITGNDAESTDYVLSEASLCPACGARLQTGYWRWSHSPEGGRIAFILPGSLIALKKT